MPWRSAFFMAVSAEVPGPAVYHVALVVRVVETRLKLYPQRANAALSTLIWLVICDDGTSPFAIPVPC